MTKEFIPEIPELDPNYVSFLNDKLADTFPVGEYVAYYNGELIGHGTNREVLVQFLGEEQRGPVFLTEVTDEEQVLDIPTPLSVE